MLIRFVVDCLVPLETLRSDSFRDFLYSINPYFQPPDPAHFRDDLLSAAHADLTAHLSALAASSHGVSITTDGWTSNTNAQCVVCCCTMFLLDSFKLTSSFWQLLYSCRFTATTAHFVAADSTLHSVVLDVSESTDVSKTEENNTRHLLRVTQAFGITDKCTSIVADGASNVNRIGELWMSRLQELEAGESPVHRPIFQIHCVGHRLSLVMEAVCKSPDIAPTISQCQQIAKQIRASPSLSHE